MESLYQARIMSSHECVCWRYRLCLFLQFVRFNFGTLPTGWDFFLFYLVYANNTIRIINCDFCIFRMVVDSPHIPSSPLLFSKLQPFTDPFMVIIMIPLFVVLKCNTNPYRSVPPCLCICLFPLDIGIKRR